MKKWQLTTILMAMVVLPAACGGSGPNSPVYDPGKNNQFTPDPPQPVDGVTQVQMKNVTFKVDPLIGMDIRWLRGELASKKRGVPPIFDDKRSFVMTINAAEIALPAEAMTVLMNNYVFAYPESPLKQLKVSTEGSQIKQSGIMHKVIDLPFEMVGNLTPTPQGMIRLSPTSIKAGGIPSQGLMGLLGLQMASLINVNEERGVKLEGNDIIMNPEKLFPPPAIRGRVTGCRIEGNNIIQIFGPGGNNPASIDTDELNPPADEPNYMYYQGGTLRFGKLTMGKTDLQIYDEDPSDYFDFYIDRYQEQLVAGTSKMTMQNALIVSMPDLHSLPNRNGTGSSSANAQYRSSSSTTKTVSSQSQKRVVR